MTVDSSASQSMRLPAMGIPGSAPVSAQPEAAQRTPHPSLPLVASSGPPAAAPAATAPPASAPVQAKPAVSGFLVQQPSSKLWMEAVPMRCGLGLYIQKSVHLPLCHTALSTTVRDQGKQLRHFFACTSL